MYKITDTWPNTYGEISQVNPIRWEILFRESGDSFVSQSGLIKCKDFFNELVRKYATGQDSAIYSFDTKTVKLNEEGVYFRMHKTMVNFSNNIDAVINTSDNSDLHVTTELLEKGTVLLFIPRYYFTSTYLTSLVTYLIRCCNCAKKLKSLDDLWESTEDIAIQGHGRDLAKAWGLSVPEEYRQFWYYCGKTVNSVVDPSPYSAGIVHNNGVMSWSAGGAK